MEKVESVACGACGGRLPPPARTGRPRRYCSPACRKRAQRDRLDRDETGWSSIAGELEEMVPADPLTVQRQSFDAVASLLDGQPAGAPEDQLARALVEQRTLLWRFRRLEPELPPQLASRTGTLVEHLQAGLDRTFAEVLA